MATKPATTVTLKHLAASLAEDNELTKKQAEAILGGFIGQIVKHLKKGERIRIGGLESCRYASAQHAWAVIRLRAKRSKSKQAKRLPSARQKS